MANRNNSNFQFELEESASNPLAPSAGNIQIFAKNGTFFIQSSSGIGNLVTGSSSEVGSSYTEPAGVIKLFAGTGAPTGYLFCTGQTVSRSTYSSLFSAISTIYGTGDGSTTFHIPDLRGRVPIGKENTETRITTTGCGINGASLGATGGSQTHTLVTSEMPGHTHDFGGNRLTNTTTGGGAARISDMLSNGSGQSAQTTSTGGDSPHNNVQPSIVLNYIIKT